MRSLLDFVLSPALMLGAVTTRGEAKQTLRGEGGGEHGDNWAGKRDEKEEQDISACLGRKVREFVALVSIFRTVERD
jgi:hypothetical protein